MNRSAVLIGLAIVVGSLGTAAGAVEKIDTPVSLLSTAIGTQIAIDYNGTLKGELVKGLFARTIFTLASVSKDQQSWVFDINTIANTSIEELKGARVTAFGFDGFKTPIVKAAIDNKIFSNVTLGSDIAGYGSVGVCFSAPGKEPCLGPSDGGLAIGEATGKGSTFTLFLEGAVERLNLDHFFVGYEGADQGLTGVGVVEKISVFNPLDPLPEPAMWIQFIIGFGAIGSILRRRKPVATR